MKYKVFYCSQWVQQELYFDDEEKLARFIFPRQEIGDYFTIRENLTGFSSTLSFDGKKQMTIEEITDYIKSVSTM